MKLDNSHAVSNQGVTFNMSYIIQRAHIFSILHIIFFSKYICHTFVTLNVQGSVSDH